MRRGNFSSERLYYLPRDKYICPHRREGRGASRCLLSRRFLASRARLLFFDKPRQLFFPPLRGEAKDIAAPRQLWRQRYIIIVADFSYSFINPSLTWIDVSFSLSRHDEDDEYFFDRDYFPVHDEIAKRKLDRWAHSRIHTADVITKHTSDKISLCEKGSLRGPLSEVDDDDDDGRRGIRNHKREKETRSRTRVGDLLLKHRKKTLIKTLLKPLADAGRVAASRLRSQMQRAPSRIYDGEVS